MRQWHGVCLSAKWFVVLTYPMHLLYTHHTRKCHHASASAIQHARHSHSARRHQAFFPTSADRLTRRNKANLSLPSPRSLRFQKPLRTKSCSYLMSIAEV
eukprot:89200-Rhodomonas_salina.3